MFWMATAILIATNIIISLIMVPILLVASEIQIFFVMIFGFFSGYLFNLLLRNIDNLEKKHYIISAFLIPALAMVNVFVMMGMMQKIGDAIGIATTQNPLAISGAYAMAFLLPHLWMNVIRKDKFKGELKEYELDTNLPEKVQSVK